MAAEPAATPAPADDVPAWTKAHLEGPLSAAETRAFMRELAQFVFDNHLKQSAASPQRGMIYEYFDVGRKGQFDQYPEGEALDTMHDGAWFAAAMVHACRATGDRFYREFLVRWQMPFYCKMLNHSDELFSARRNDARPEAKPWGKPWALVEGEKGFVPYFWDDGASVSIERRIDKNPLGPFPCTDNLAGQPNPQYRLDGYSHGCSNHMAQDLGVMVEAAWLLLRASRDPAEQQLAGEVAAAAKNLHESRMRHFGPIPMCVAPAALAAGDAALMKRVPAADEPRVTDLASGVYVRALAAPKPGEKLIMPSFADNEEYRYYYSMAKTGGDMPRPLAFRIVYDALATILQYRCYCDDCLVPAGTNRSEAFALNFVDGKLEDYRSDRKGHAHEPKPSGSRMGPQNMVCCGWALQVLRAMPGIWEERYTKHHADELRVLIDDPLPTGQRFDVRPATLKLEGRSLAIGSTRDALLLETTVAADTSIMLFSRPDGQGSSATVTLSPSGVATAVSDRGEKLLLKSTAAKAADGMVFKLAIPYTVCKPQGHWLNGVEHGRYSIRFGGQTRNFYLASSEQQVRAWLEHELGAGLRTWRAIFRERSYIPTVLGKHKPFDQFSDSGGYAHLISAGAEWLLYLDGRRDWQLLQVPPIAAPPK